MILGAQLWSLREYCKTLTDFSNTLKRVSDIGYTTVQVSGTCPYDAQWLKHELDKNNLTCNITHYDINKIIKNPKAVSDMHKVFNCRFIGYGGKHTRPEGYNEMISKLFGPAETLCQLGNKFTYHHHAWEYIQTVSDGRTIMQYLSDCFSPKQMNFTLDTYWVKYGGADIISEVNRLSGRIECVHLKDMLILPNGEKRMAWVGGGNCMNFEEIIDALIKSGSKYAFVEQDECYGADPFEELKKSYDYLTSLGLK